jgi:hypothetical protein
VIDHLKHLIYCNYSLTKLTIIKSYLNCGLLGFGTV